MLSCKEFSICIKRWHGNIQINLPFSPAALTDRGVDAACTFEISGVASANVSDFQGTINEGSNVIFVTLGDSTTRQTDSAEEIQASTQITFSLQYRV